MLISLLIPYFSPCDINFDMTRLAFISGCAPGRHPITTFQNTYAIVLPVSCMCVNLSIIFHLRFVRNNSYATFLRKFRKVEPTRSTSQSTFISKQRAKKDMMMIRQTITMAAYLSFYEFGAVIIKIFPALYVGLSPAGKLLYFYVRMEAVAFMNFLIYFVESKKTRIMVCRYLKIGTKPGSNLITVSQHRTVSGSTGNVATVTN
ncbi:Protein CBG28035 [Caenorhabditis briggsae]|uniref:Protein CBG28035 n=1 Tax=Caenorhabditis briggsae TaxID=6238 RepID=B6IGM5_CAEBR|nr:Protein CBG28035 [Caenorhabditis briggsae]CAR99055.1 Protein CBG28035 [Caenorhabditis briggsae]